MLENNKKASKLLSTDELAKFFNVSKTTVYRLIATRKIPFYKVGGVVRFSEEDISNYLEENKINMMK